MSLGLPQFEVVNKVRFYNPTLEDHRIQENNKFYFFKAGSYCDIGADTAREFYKQWRKKGIFPVLPGEDFEARKREALLTYLKEDLPWRIHYHQQYIDECTRAGKTIVEPQDLKRLKRWQEELTNVLNATAPIEEERSFTMPEPEAKTAPKKTKKASEEASGQEAL